MAATDGGRDTARASLQMPGEDCKFKYVGDDVSLPKMFFRPVGDNMGAEDPSLIHSSYNGHAPYQPQPLEQGSWQPPSASQGYYQAHAQVQPVT